MLKSLATLVFLIFGILASAQQPFPVQGGHQQEQPQSHSDKPQSNAPPSCVSEVNKENADNAERYAYYKTHPKEYLEAAIAPANLSNWILAGLGVVGGILATLTLFILKRQVDMFISKERARLTIEIKPFQIGKTTDWNSVDFVVTNHGATNAFIRRARCKACVNVAHWDMKNLFLDSEMHLPRTIPPDINGTKTVEFVATGDNFLGELDQAIQESLRIRKTQIFAVGFIEYSDVFAGEWRLNFCHRWGGDYSVGSWFFIDEWPEYPRYPNGEEKVKKHRWWKFWQPREEILMRFRPN